MFRQFVQFECFDVCQGLRLRESRNRFERGARTRADNHVGSPKLTGCSIRRCDFYGPWTDKATGAEDEFRSGAAVIVEIHVIQTRYHRTLAIAHRSHVDREGLLGYAELLASPEVG